MSEPPRPDDLTPPRPSTGGPPFQSPGDEAPSAAEPFAADAPILESAAPNFHNSPPGPGLPESLVWTVGVLAVHLGGAIFVVLLIGLAAGLARGVQQIPAAMREIDPTSMLLLGGEQLIFVLVATGAVLLRLSPGFRHKLALRPVATSHLLILVLLVLPISICSGELYRIVHLGWEAVTRAVPELAVLDSANIVAQMQNLVDGAPLPLLLMVMAVAPALGEEIIFRGVVGRGLVARWGVYGGVFLSSALFAAVHMHPAHVLSVLPIGIILHLIYLTTRSFWAPVLFHFLNNAWATVAVKYLGADESEAVPLVMLVPALVCIVALLNLLWTTRVEFTLPDGRRWTPGYPTAEAPPTQVGATPQRAGATTGAIAFTAVGVIGVVLAMVWTAFV